MINPICNNDFEQASMSSQPYPPSGDTPVTNQHWSNEYINIDDSNIVEGKRERGTTQPFNATTFRVCTHELATLEARLDAITHLVRETPLYKKHLVDPNARGSKKHTIKRSNLFSITQLILFPKNMKSMLPPLRRRLTQG